MEPHELKRTKKAVDHSLKKKVQDLPLLCVAAICKFTPTSQLVRLHSTAVPLPGAFWSFGLETELKKRRPFSLSEDPVYGRHDAPRIHLLSDSSGAKVAVVKRLEEFRFSPLCEFVESAWVRLVIIPRFAGAETYLGYVISGQPQPLLPHLPNVTKLTLMTLDNSPDLYSRKTRYEEDLLIPVLRKTLPQLESFSDNSGTTELAMTLFDMLPKMTVLKHLDVHHSTVATLMRAATAGAEESEVLRHALSGLRSLRFQCFRASDRMGSQFLSFISGYCRQLTHLSIAAWDEFKPYLKAIGAFASLTTLDLRLHDIKTNGITFNEDEAVSSVLELHLDYPVHVAIASLFPNVRVAKLDYGTDAVELCERRVWPSLEKLVFFEPDPDLASSATELLAAKNLPSVVDFSPAIIDCFACDLDALTAIYQAMQSGSVKMLRMRGPLHREALPRLQTHLDLNGLNAKVTAWRDRDLGDQSSCMRDGVVVAHVVKLSQQTDFRIVGTKTCGSLKGGQFTIRVVHQHT